MKHDDLRTARQMRDAGRYVRLLIADQSRASFAADGVRHLAVLHLVQAIGEAASGTSDTFRGAHPDIPWAEMIAMRTLIVRRYDDANYDLAWHAASEGVERLLFALERIVPLNPESLML